MKRAEKIKDRIGIISRLEVGKNINIIFKNVLKFPDTGVFVDSPQ